MHITRTLLIATISTCVLLGCLDVMSEPMWPDSGTIVTKVLAPDHVAEAVLIAIKERGRYLFEIRELESNDTLAQKEISAPLGYHEHVIHLYWLDSRRAEATIDHDFGDNSLKFTLSY